MTKRPTSMLVKENRKLKKKLKRARKEARRMEVQFLELLALSRTERAVEAAAYPDRGWGHSYPMDYK